MCHNYLMPSYELRIGVKALIPRDKGRYLFLQRSHNLPDGSGIRWDTPGGHMEDDDETLKEALAREVDEETKLLVVGTPDVINAQDIILPNQGLHIVRITMLADAIGEVVLNPNEHQDQCLATIPEALETLNVDDYLRITLHKLLK